MQSVLVLHWQTQNRSLCVQFNGRYKTYFIIFLCFFSRGIPNYDFKIGRITFIRNSRPLVKKVEEVNKVESSPVFDPSLWPLSLSSWFFYSMLLLKSGSSLEWFELREATSGVLVTDGNRLACCQFNKPVHTPFSWLKGHQNAILFSGRKWFLSRLRMWNVYSQWLLWWSVLANNRSAFITHKQWAKR